jgi:hypothetical protein
MALHWSLLRRPGREHGQIRDTARESHSNAQIQEEVRKVIENIEQTWEAELLARGRSEGEIQAYRAILVSQIQERFGSVPEEWAARIAAADLPRLQAAARQVIHVRSLDQLQL